MTERPEDPQVDETTEDTVEPTESDATDPVVASGSESAPGSGEVAEPAGNGEPAAPEESPATAPEESAPPEEPPAAPAGAGRAREEAAPAPRRDRGDASAAVEVRATARYVRTSARKARLVCDHIRGKSVTEARAILAFTPRAAAKPWSKLLESAVANAEHNHELVGEDLRIAAVLADEGPTLKRFQPRAMGRATKIRKRTSHLTIILSPLDVPAGTRRGARRKGGR